MSAAAVALVELSCSVRHVSDATVVIEHDGRITSLPRRAVEEIGPRFVLIPQAIAASVSESAVEPLDEAALARRFGRSRDWVYRNIARLVAEEEFPPPLSRFGHRRYAREAVDAWFMGERPKPRSATPEPRPEPRPQAPPAPALALDEADAQEWRRALAAEYGA
ncbi:helix-turn-helix transcriptional regulator [Chenggangzhangella methanolivorans]|uniref:Helix-turn-helix domain-containing protein n=1 Tax=Chenggangzhangella methanolivorans TaxID=1437009 RepID=A0A9E6R785_9HYPH|nr:hypothetical protein [Chenggangzhangella methanolivorans]QZN99497.1 hypothetical protein K6K41_22755 [Chenggangzhangella methanolivorans]